MSTDYEEYTSAVADGSSTGVMAEVTEPEYVRASLAPVAVQCPATMTTVVANLQYSDDNSRWDDLYDDAGAKLTFSAVQGTRVMLQPAKYPTLAKYFRIKLASNNGSGSTITFRIYTRAV
jgi:hypothetical protein